MSISENSRIQTGREIKMETIFTNPENARPAVYTFDGDVYTGLDAYTPVRKS